MARSSRPAINMVKEKFSSPPMQTMERVMERTMPSLMGQEQKKAEAGIADKMRKMFRK